MKNPLELISKFALKLLAPLPANETYKLIVSEALRLVGGEYGHIVLRESKQFKRVFTTSPIPYTSPVRQKANSFRAYSKKQILVVPASKASKAHPEVEKLKIKYTILIPLSYKNQSVGVLIIASKNDIVLSKHDLTILRLFGSMASLAIRKTQLYEETKTSLEARDHFISMAAHELKTPLTSVSGYIQLLYSKLANADTSESRWIEQLYQESRRLQNLVSELLEINRIRSGEFNYALGVCNLRKILEDVKKIIRFSSPDREIIFQDRLNDLPDNIIADHDKILQVFTNLIDNAVKFSPASSTIKIVLDFKDNDFIVSIKDEGIGIPKDEVEKIFEGYKQGSGHNREGMGLGLFLVKNILTRLNGSIKVRSRVGIGTTMEIRLPKADI